jgi:integrase
VQGFLNLHKYYTGFRFRDATHFFNYDVHVIDEERIMIDTEKYGTEVNILIHGRLRKVLDIIKDHPLKIFKQGIQQLYQCAGNDGKTRHPDHGTFRAPHIRSSPGATGYFKRKGSEIIGHKDKRSTEVYYHIVDKSLDKEMRKWDE